MIIDTYFNKHTFADRVQDIIDELTQMLHFRIDRPLFRGTVYGPSRLGSIIYKGMWKKKDAILKIQGLKLQRDEKKLIDGFLDQNESAHIRMPHIFKHKPWDSTRGYGYTLMEYIPDPPLMTPEPSETEINEFLKFFTELKTRAIANPWIEQTEYEQSSVRLVRHRIAQWVAIAKERGHFDIVALAPRIQQFNELLEKMTHELPMEFMHAHMTGREVRKHNASGQYILFANLYWGWRPKWYDCAFVVWNILRNPESPLMNETQTMDCITMWKEQFEALPWIKEDASFPAAFDIMMLERLLGILIIDLHVDEQQTHERQVLFNKFLKTFDRLISRA